MCSEAVDDGKVGWVLKKGRNKLSIFRGQVEFFKMIFEDRSFNKLFQVILGGKSPIRISRSENFVKDH